MQHKFAVTVKAAVKGGDASFEMHHNSAAPCFMS